MCELEGFRDFVCMYIGEGFKRKRHVVSVANSDPTVVQLADHWIRWLSRNKVSHTVQYHADQDLAELRTFWGELLGVPAESIRLQRESNSNQLSGRTWRSEHGVLTVRTGDTILRARVQGWMERCRQSWLDSIAHGV